jgi:hypothetical protein
MRSRLALALCVCALHAPRAPQEELPAPIRAALQAWRAEHGPEWQLVYDQLTLHGRMLFGGGAPARSLPRGDPGWRLLARHFVDEARPLLGIEPETLRDEPVVALPLAALGTTDKLAVRFRQELGGVPVERGFVDVVFERATGTLLAIDSQALPDSSVALGATVAPAEARAVSDRAFARETGAGIARATGPELVIARPEATAGLPVLVWRTDLAGQRSDGEPVARAYLVAARGTPALLESRDRIYDALPRAPQEPGRVLANATADGCCFAADDGTNRVRVPLASLTLRFADGSLRTTDADGGFDASGALLPASARLQGPFVSVHNDEFWPEGDLGVETRAIAEITLNPAPAERDVAQTNAFLRAGQTRAWVRRTNPFDPTLDSSTAAPGVPYQLIANWVIPYGQPGGQTGMAPCNSLYDAVLQVIKLSVSGADFGASCPNASFAPIVWHELGHWLNERYDSGNDRAGFGEGNADAFALYQMDQPELVYGSLARSGENDEPFCGDCRSRQGCQEETHRDGLPLMGALWKARRELETSLGRSAGAATADALFLGWMNAFDQGEIHSLIEWQWLVLDDDDHDVTDGTPHLLELDAGFRAQGFPGYRLPVTTVVCR